MENKAERWLRCCVEPLLRRVGVREGHTVLDFGCNEGIYTRAAADIVATHGKVYALDKNAEALDKVRGAARKSGLANIDYLHVSEGDDIPLPDRSADVVLLYDVLHRGYFPDRQQRAHVLAEARRVLKPRGLLSLYPTHLKQYGMTFLKQINEAKNAGLRLVEGPRRRLVHDGRLVRGRVFALRPAVGSHVPQADIAAARPCAVCGQLGRA